ncbi:TPA: type IV pilus biogenesis protein PilP [Citrobacter freundii]|nr:type IV pilus biogenesis protein PilP [Citrobacter freundii]
MAYVQKTVIQKIKITIFFMFSIATVFATNAAEVSMGNLDDLQAERVLYEAKAALLKAKNAAAGNASAETVITSGTSNNVPGAVGISSSGVNTPVSLQSEIPKLSKINGRKAELILSNGDTVIVTSGAMLPGGRWQVTGVGLSGVTIKNINTSAKQTIN